MLRWMMVLVGVSVAVIVNRNVRGDRRRGAIVLAGTLGGLLLGLATAYLLSPATFRLRGLDVLDICLFTGVLFGIVGGWLVGFRIHQARSLSAGRRNCQTRGT